MHSGLRHGWVPVTPRAAQCLWLRALRPHPPHPIPTPHHVAQVGMEMWARWAHKALWHDFAPGWSLHKSHHELRVGPWEANDLFAIINAGPAIGLCLYGFLTPNLLGGLCFGAGEMPQILKGCPRHWPRDPASSQCLCCSCPAFHLLQPARLGEGSGPCSLQAVSLASAAATLAALAAATA